MPQLGDPRFHQSVTYLFEHNADGAMGVIINKPLDLPVGELFAQLDIDAAREAYPGVSVLYGGPVQETRGFVLHRTADGCPPWKHGIAFPSGITLATSRDVLEAIAAGTGPARALVALGYAGWSAGQLEREMAENSWIPVPADPGILFDLPFEERWHAAARRLGIDLSLISPEAGHA